MVITLVSSPEVNTYMSDIIKITLVSSPEVNTHMSDIIKIFSYQICYFISPLFVYRHYVFSFLFFYIKRVLDKGKQK